MDYSNKPYNLKVSRWRHPRDRLRHDNITLKTLKVEKLGNRGQQGPQTAIEREPQVSQKKKGTETPQTNVSPKPGQILGFLPMQGQGDSCSLI